MSMGFPKIPDIIDVPSPSSATGYTLPIDEDTLKRLDEFLVKREEWKRRWESLPAPVRESFERYINKNL
jgi:hypothetical protein